MGISLFSQFPKSYSRDLQMKDVKEIPALYQIGLRETYWIRFVGFEQVALAQIRVLDLEVHNYE